MKERIRTWYERLFFTPKNLPPASYSNQESIDPEFPYRLHLRVQPDGTGVLIVNASTVLHLNQTAAEFAYHLIKQTPFETMVSEIKKRYRIDDVQVRSDIQDFKTRVETLISTPDLDPVTYLNFDRVAPYSGPISAPYRLDCSLTYRVTEKNNEEAAPLDRVHRELGTDEWKQVLGKAWDAGIPHVVFTGGEPTLRPDLPALIACAEKKGIVTGLITDGLKFLDKDYLNELLQSGLDHLMFILRTDMFKSWKALENVLKADIFTSVHFTLTSSNRSTALKDLERIHSLGAGSLSLSAESIDLKDQLHSIRNAAAEMGLSLVWDLPVPYSSLHPVSMELSDVEEISAGAGKAWLYLEPDGDVLAAQGMPEVYGNLLTDPWETIWSRLQPPSA